MERISFYPKDNPRYIGLLGQLAYSILEPSITPSQVIFCAYEREYLPVSSGAFPTSNIPALVSALSSSGIPWGLFSRLTHGRRVYLALNPSLWTEFTINRRENDGGTPSICARWDFYRSSLKRFVPHQIINDTYYSLWESSHGSSDDSPMRS